MDFYKSAENDIDEIVELLKLSLGEGTTQKTKQFWIWKHLQNPFGVSKIILARENNMLIGVRAFMMWSFENDTRTYKCARAVDTAVHPDYQGKGIFTKLTLKALDECKQDGVVFIYNTPNKISKIGYLKMGWLENGKLPIRFSFPLKFPRLYNEKLSLDVYKKYFLNWNNNVSIKKSKSIETIVNIEYIMWRYVNCPAFQYGFLSDENSFLIVFRLKKIKQFIELRICEVVLPDNAESIINAVSKLKKLVNDIKPLFISCTQQNSIPKSFYKMFFFTPQLSVGPTTTLRNLNADSLNQFSKFKNWQPSLGCMELF